MEKDKNLENLVSAQKKQSTIKTLIVDTIGNVAGSLVAGSVLDYCSGLSLPGIIASRASATVMNSATGGLYGWWREKTFKITKTNKDSGSLRKTLADLLAFNSFQIPVYATAVAIGSLVSEGEVNMEKVQNGAIYLAAVSPLAGPTMGLYMDGCRKLFGLKSASEGSYKQEQ